MQIPVIALTSDGSPAAIVAGARAGAVYHLSKPPDIEALLEVIDRVLHVRDCASQR